MAPSGRGFRYRRRSYELFRRRLLVRRIIRIIENVQSMARAQPEDFSNGRGIDMELRWLQLARSYQFLWQLRAFSAEHDKQSGELSARLEKLKGKTALSTNGHRG